MKLITILAALALMVGCSSSDKKEDVKADEAQTEQAAQVDETADEDQAAEEGEAEEDGEAKPAQTSGAEVSMRPADEGSGASTFSPVVGDVTESYECTNQQDSRKIEVTTAQGQTPLCGVNYTKFGTTNTVAIANVDASHCSKVATQIRDSLTSANFNCGGSGSAANTSAPAAPSAAEAEEETSELQPEATGTEE